MLAVIEAKKVLENGGYSEIDHIFVNKVPEKVIRELEKFPAKTVVRISEVNDTPFDYGNDDFLSIERTVQVQIFYAEDFSKSVDDFEVQIMKLFQKNNWRVTESKPHYLDPDTEQSIKVFYFTKIKFL